jgi:hypothetical protein
MEPFKHNSEYIYTTECDNLCLFIDSLEFCDPWAIFKLYETIY